MNLVVNCECGETVRAEDDGELVAQVEAHVEQNHPEMVGKLSVTTSSGWPRRSSACGSSSIS